jgi:hypothetical protein
MLAEAFTMDITAVAHAPAMLLVVFPAMRTIVMRHAVTRPVVAMAFSIAIIRVAVVIMMIHHHHVPAGPVERAEKE